MTSFYVQSNCGSNTRKVAQMTIMFCMYYLQVIMLTFDIYLAG